MPSLHLHGKVALARNADAFCWGACGTRSLAMFISEFKVNLSKAYLLKSRRPDAQLLPSGPCSGAG